MKELKATRIGLAVILICAAVIAMTPDTPEASDENPGNDSAQSFTVVELFTSEGCSSCPAAEKVFKTSWMTLPRPQWRLIISRKQIISCSLTTALYATATLIAL